MKKRFIIGVAVIVMGLTVGYFTTSNDFFSSIGNSNDNVIESGDPLGHIEPVSPAPAPQSPQQKTSPEDPNELKPDVPTTKSPAPEPVPEPEPAPAIPNLTPAEMRANYKTLDGVRVASTGIIKREWICDAVEGSSRNCMTSMSLTDISDDYFATNLIDTAGESIQCKGMVNTCKGFTDGEVVTLTGTIVVRSIGFAFQLD